MRRDTASQVIVNGRFLARRITGVERYGREILKCIKSNSTLESTSWQGWKGHAWEQFILPGRLSRHSVLWSPANTGPLTVRRQALTIHDLSPLEHPEWFHASFAAWYRLFLPILAKRVQTIFTPAEYVKQKVIRRFGVKNVVVTPNGVDHSLFHPYAKQTRFDLPQDYVLFVGTLEPRKNLGGLLQAWNKIKDEFGEMWLVIVGVSGNVFKSIHVSHDMERVRFLGYVDDETLAGLYANASLFVLPSQDEGFGLPALEAMASGTPVIVSDGGALPEVVGDAGLTFKLGCHSPERTPGGRGRSEASRRGAAEMLRRGAFSATPQHNMSDLTHAIRVCLSDAALRDGLREKGMERVKKFSWPTTADIVWKSLHEI